MLAYVITAAVSLLAGAVSAFMFIKSAQTRSAKNEYREDLCRSVLQTAASMEASCKRYGKLTDALGKKDMDEESLGKLADAITQANGYIHVYNRALSGFMPNMRRGGKKAEKELDRLAAEISDSADNLQIMNDELSALLKGQETFLQKGSKPSQKIKDMDIFHGCKDKKQAAARYRALSKVLHPDSSTGDTELFKALQKARVEAESMLGE